MSGYKTDQRRVLHRGREFHFVSYDGAPANTRLGQAATQPAWYLMTAGKRWAVMPQVSEQSESALVVAFQVWLDAHVFTAAHAGPPTIRLRRHLT